ncbi:hypothetical protein, partial [Enterococcus casseliflavus]|uniref:hypothetical protein n=1 Tax=Enterococcus casseliflavus TaxID=37734 RepID=UPI003D0D6CF9
RVDRLQHRIARIVGKSQEDGQIDLEAAVVARDAGLPRAQTEGGLLGVPGSPVVISISEGKQSA